MENKNLNGYWVEELDAHGVLNLKYMVSDSDVPRIIIYCSKLPNRPDVWKIFMIRGDSVDYNLSPEMESVLENKIDLMLNEHMIVDWSANFWKNKILSYVKRIGEVYKKHNDGIDLTVSDIEFIYMLIDFWIKRPLIEDTVKLRKDPDKVIKNLGADDYISFGDSPDPRMLEIISQRDHQKDFEKLSDNSKISFLRKYDFFEIKINDPKLIIESRKIQYASDELLKDTTFIRKFMSSNPYCFILPYTKLNINKNKNIVLTHFKNLSTSSNSSLLKYVSPSLQDDIDVVKLALMINGNNIKYASNRLKNDRAIVILAILNECDIKEENFPLTMLETYPEIKNIVDIIDIINVYAKIKDNEVKRVLSNSLITLIKHSPPEIRGSYKIMNKAFKMNPEAINFANPRVQDRLRNR